MLPHPLTNFETQNCYQNKPKFSGIYSRNFFSKIKGEVYVRNPPEYESISAHWRA